MALRLSKDARRRVAVANLRVLAGREELTAAEDALISVVCGLEATATVTMETAPIDAQDLTVLALSVKLAERGLAVGPVFKAVGTVEPPQ